MDDITRREFVGAAVLTGSAIELAEAQSPATGPGELRCSLKINGQARDVSIDPRTTLLDLLRENLHLSGTKKGCDHGQCGACTVLANGRRINSCLSLALSYDGAEITTIEGLASAEQLHPCKRHSSSTTVSSAATARPARSVRRPRSTKKRARACPAR